MPVWEGCWLAIEEQDANFSGFNLVTDYSYYNILIITNRFALHSLCSGDGGAVAYALVSGSDRKFEVDVSTGLVTTVDYLDYETKTTYLMNVSATDQAPPFHQGFCTVYVTLLNELDEAVAFFSAGYEASLRENIATGTEVVQVQAQSADNLNQLTYRFDPDTSPAALALFKIDSVTVSRGWGNFPLYPSLLSQRVAWKNGIPYLKRKVCLPSVRDKSICSPLLLCGQRADRTFTHE